MSFSRWQFPPGEKQPEAFLLRSELRRLRLERDKKLKEQSEEQNQLPQVVKHSYKTCSCSSSFGTSLTETVRSFWLKLSISN